MNKRFVSWFLMLMVLITAVPALGEADAKPVEVVVGSVNQMSGYFFTDLWGNNTADVDVRALLHGYSTIAYGAGGTYAVDQTVVRNIVATQINGSDDKTYTVTLNPDLTYNDGTPITAADYVFSVLLQAAPEIAALGGASTSMVQLVGHDAYASGETAVFSGVRFLSDTEFSMTISGDYLPYFYELLYLNVTPYPLHVLAPGFKVADDGDGAYLRYAGEAEEAPALADVLRETILDAENGYLYNPRVTSGAYQLVSYDAGAHVATFEINGRYLGNFEGRKPAIDRIVFKQVSNATMLDALESGDVDIINKVTVGDVIADGLARVSAAGSAIKATNYLRAGFAFISLSCEHGVTQSQNVRQALAYCVDAEGYIENFLYGFGRRTYGYYGYGQWMAADLLEALDGELQHYELDVGKAIELLEADGFTLNADGEAYNAADGGTRYRRNEDGTLEALSVRWALLSDSPACAELQKNSVTYMEQAGFKVWVDEISFSQMLAHYYRRIDRIYDMFFMATNFDFIFDPYYTFNGDEAYQGVRNTSGIDDEELLRLANELRHTDVGDNEAYKAKWLELQKRFSEILPVIPLYSNVYFDFYSSEIYGYAPNAYYSWAQAILYATYGYEEQTGETTEVPSDAAADTETVGVGG